MEREEFINNITKCDENLEKQHSIQSEQKQLTSADISATDVHLLKGEQVKQPSTGKEIMNEESFNDNTTTVNVVNTTQIPANTEEVQKSITSVINGKVEEGDETVTITKATNSQENVSNANNSNESNKHDVGEGNGQTKPTSVSTSSSVNNSPSVRYSDLTEKHDEVMEVNNVKVQHEDCDLKLQQQMLQYEQQMEQLKAALQQKDNMITLFQRENAILEKEKEALIERGE